ncbi:MAG: beta-propeller domain-containing protein [Candidatus Bathyarchaeota archaeon]
MESRIKKKAMLYGVLAILLVAFVAAFAFRFGLYDPRTGPLPPSPAIQSTLLTTFNSHEALRDFLASNTGTTGPYPFFGPEDINALDTLTKATLREQWGLSDYSTTNIQVTGVDEADIVKTDGEYLYVLSSGSLLIVKAYPPEVAEVVTNMTFDDLYPIGIFVKGDRLTVLGSKYVVPTFLDRMYGLYVVDIKTFVRIYDIQDKANPVLLRNLMLTGSYFNSRMIDDYLYFVVSQPAYIIYDTVVLPKIYQNDILVKEIAPSEIHYHNGTDNYYQYTTFVAMNMQDTTETPTFVTVMMGGTSNMYVSQNNMYVTFPEVNGTTTIYRMRIQASNITVKAKGQVIGNVLNQFSMDEHDGYFRIATSTWIDGDPRSNLFIMDMDLIEVGKLLDIEVGETLDSARFVADRCYLSTSVVRRDPFFVIDVEDVTTPKILGYLKIPGFNRYLHPYDENHVIGLGRDEFNNVKISFFNVTNVSAPKLISEHRFEGAWSDTPALWDHHAFLFAYTKDLLALPVSINQYSFDRYTTKQGFFVFNITLINGLVLKGNITHQELATEDWDTRPHVRRGLYIANVLYTVSDAKIKLNDLENLTLLKEIPLD